jgi:riboflavin biosynthesis pyrimidine reductase
MSLRRLHPAPATFATAAELLADADLGALAPPDRPYVVLNMVASVDGRATYEGRSGPLGGPADKDMFHTLRTLVDAVMVGTGTLRAERYGRMVRDPARQEQRRARGLDPEPYAIVPSRSGSFPEDVPLFTDPEARVLRFTDASPADVLRRAREEHGIRSVLCEGGPTLNGALLAEGVVDELFLTVASVIAGGPDPLTIVEGPGPGTPVPLELVWLLEGDGMLFCRYAVARAG